MSLGVRSVFLSPVLFVSCFLADMIGTSFLHNAFLPSHVYSGASQLWTESKKHQPNLLSCRRAVLFLSVTGKWWVYVLHPHHIFTVRRVYFPTIWLIGFGHVTCCASYNTRCDYDQNTQLYWHSLDCPLVLLWSSICTCPQKAALISPWAHQSEYYDCISHQVLLCIIMTVLQQEYSAIRASSKY